MTDSLNSPGIRQALERLIRRVDDLERRLRQRATDPAPGYLYDEVVFSMDTLSVAASGRWYPGHTVEIYQAVASLKTAGSSTTTVVVKVNGGTQATINLASSDQYEAASMDDALVADTDYATVETTAVGTSAAGLVVTLRFRRRG